MKKLALILAIAMIAAFSAPAFATDLTITGDYYLNAVNSDPGYTAPAQTDNDEYYDQQMRTSWTWAINDNVSAHFRCDFNDMQWGEDTFGGVWQRASTGGAGGNPEFHVDRTYVQIAKDFYTLRVGQQYARVGNAIMWEANYFGFKLDLAFAPVTVGLKYAKIDENGDRIDSNLNADHDSYAVNVNFASEQFTIGAAYAANIDDGPVDDIVRTGFALYGTAAIGPVNLKAELDIMDGDNGAGQDLKGTQFYLDGSFAATEIVTFGATAVYAPGNNSATETQITNVYAAGAAFTPFDFGGAMNGDLGYYGGSNGIFDVEGTDSGVLGLIGRADFAINEAIKIYTRLGYAQPEDATDMDYIFGAIGSVDYTWMPNVTVSAGVAYIAPDYDVANDDPKLDLIARLGVAF